MSTPLHTSDFQPRPLPRFWKTLSWIFYAVGFGAMLGAIALDPLSAGPFSLMTYAFLLSVSLGSLFFIALEHVTGAVWSVPFRRIAEFFTPTAAVLPLFILPLLSGNLTPLQWTAGLGASQNVEVVGYFTPTFLWIRTIVCLCLWLIFFSLLTRNSQKQDDTPSETAAHRNVTLSAIFMPVFVITLTLTAIDWLMSPEHRWFSTIFGVYYIAGSAVAALSAITFTAVLLQERGYLHPAVGRDHFYNLGTLLFGFNCLWGYIAFSQYLLVWYADLPEETQWFTSRWTGGWKGLTLALILAHVVVPFFVLLSRSARSNLTCLKLMSLWLFATHFLDVFWMIAPQFHSTAVFYLIGPGALVFSSACLIYMLCEKAKRTRLVPIGDPKLERGLAFRLR